VGCSVTRLSDPPPLLVLLPFPVQIARVKNSLLKHLALLVALHEQEILDCFFDGPSYLFSSGLTTDIARSRSPAENGFNCA